MRRRCASRSRSTVRGQAVTGRTTLGLVSTARASSPQRRRGPRWCLVAAALGSALSACGEDPRPDPVTDRSAAVYTAIATIVILLVIKKLVGLRVDEQEEIIGLDQSSHGESAYNE